MDTKFINPFLNSVHNVLSTMAMMEIKPGKPEIKKDTTARGDITGLMGMTSEQIKGSIAITFTEPMILEICNRMLGEKPESLNDTTADLVGELTNMITGGAKNLLNEMGYCFDMAIPAVVSGHKHAINHKSDGPKIIIPYKSEDGEIFVEICFE